jgi:anti-sigma regulatory factor (Ser/Thr protein kinase)
MCRVVTKHLKGRDPSLTTEARHWLAERLALWGVTAPADTAELLVSELVSNATRHGGGSPVVTLSVRHDSLEVSVTDSDLDHLPNPVDHQHSDGLPLEPTSEGGRGLAIVDALASEWGTTTTDQGKHVWFRLDADDWPHLSDCQCDTEDGTQLASGQTVHAIRGPWDD